MILELKRRWYTSKSTGGDLYIGGVHECFTIEKPDLNNQPQTSCIPEGGYDISLYFSNHNKRWVPLLHDVPNRSLIEIHPANYSSELLGCIAPGASRGIDAVYESQDAFGRLFAKIKGAIDAHEQVRIVISKSEA